jgi:hypothetical protein
MLHYPFHNIFWIINTDQEYGQETVASYGIPQWIMHNAPSHTQELKYHVLLSISRCLNQTYALLSGGLYPSFVISCQEVAFFSESEV